MIIGSGAGGGMAAWALTKLGVQHSYFEVEGLDHNQKKMIDGRKAIWFNFHIESLKLNQVPLNYLK